MDQMDQTDTVWHPTDTWLDTSPIYHIRCTFAHTNSHVFQQREPRCRMSAFRSSKQAADTWPCNWIFSQQSRCTVLVLVRLCVPHNIRDRKKQWCMDDIMLSKADCSSCHFLITFQSWLSYTCCSPTALLSSPKGSNVFDPGAVLSWRSMALGLAACFLVSW